MKLYSLVTIDPVDHLPTSPLLRHQQQQQQQQHHSRRPSITSLARSPPPLSFSKSPKRRMRSPPRTSAAKTTHHASSSSRRPSPYAGPRSSSERRLPSLFDRIKAALEAPRQPAMTIDTSAPAAPSRSPIQTSPDLWSDNPSPFASAVRSTTSAETRFHNQHYYNHEPSHNGPLYFDYPPPPPPPPTLYGMPVSVACKRAYLGQHLGIRQSLKRLQAEDAGTVEHRTIAFSTHLTVSRWESSSAPAQDSAPADLTTASGPTKAVTQAGDTASHPPASPSTSKVTAEELADHEAGLSSDQQERGAQVQLLQQQQLQHRDVHTENSNRPGPEDQLQPPRTASSSSANPVQSNPLLLLANYIRHILTLTADNSALHNQATVIHRRLTVLHAQRQQQQQLQQQHAAAQNANHTHAHTNTNTYNNSSASTSTAYSYQTPNISNSDGHAGMTSPRSRTIGPVTPRRNSRSFQDHSHSLPSPMSAGPGPFRTESSLAAKRHRQTSEYHDYQTRRHLHHQPQQQIGNVPDLWSLSSTDRRGSMLLPSPTSPTFRNEGRNNSLAAKRSTISSPIPSPSVTPRFSPLVKVPFQNLTLTLALIYVDRLKAKYPEAKGEPGCSHRLFLVAYIIAAKYRCSVEIETLLQEQQSLSSASASPSSSPRMDLQPEICGPNGEYLGGRDADDCGEMLPIKEEVSMESPEELRQQNRVALEEKIWEARSRAELIFSNYEWIRLLSLGSFFSPPPRPSSTTTMADTVSPPPPSPPLSPSMPPTVPSTAATTPLSPSMTTPGAQTQNAVLQFAPLPTAAALGSASSSAAAAGSCATLSCGIFANSSEERAKRTTSTPEETFPARSLPIQATPIKNSMAFTASSSAPSTAASTTTSHAAPMVLQVHDLDRMENEFLTFLDCDLSIGPQDLDTCWNLLVRNREI
ncbi:hypothetical protein EMPS_05858 [Entomortierella parvispora]|uniref:Cyclin N-terminal domain-containing protein n=1 Tax=Entomortierella parvispora TaxID=205924 RepID=A0A9P3HB65_9FUNG|nr:hypothetical protein EMPS_05858 [Entomortierella parvispora]